MSIHLKLNALKSLSYPKVSLKLTQILITFIINLASLFDMCALGNSNIIIH
jgi:hypothetical protein